MKNITRKILSFALALAMIVPMFVFPSSAEETTTPVLVESPDGYSNIEVRVTTDKDPISYRIGDTVTFTMKVYADNTHISVPMIKGWIEGDGNTAQGVDRYLEYITLYPDDNGVFTLTRDVISIPGYMRLEGNIYSSTGSRWAETPNNDRAYALGAGILVNYEEITTISPEPADFDAVWADRLADLDAVAPKIVRIDKVKKYYSGSSLQDLSSVTNRDVYAVYIDCPGNSGDIILGDDIGNEVGATWAVAYITVPTGKSDGTMSFSQGYQGYGINTATPSTGTGNIGINMATHSVVLLNNENAASADTYRSKYASYIKGGTGYGKDATDNSAIETCYFANLLLRDLQVLRFAKQAFGTEGAASLITDDTIINGMTKDELLTEMDYWKGLYNGVITTSGGSQGGFQAIGVAALDHDVTSVNASIPWMGDTHINTDTQRVQGGTRPTPGEGIRYCDTAFLAARVEAPVTILARLVDKSCVPTGVISIWNNLVESKKDVEGYMASIDWIQSGTHGYQPAYAENQTPTLRTYELVEPTGIANSNGNFTKSGYTDIDGYTVDQDALPPSTGYVQIATSDKTTATVAEGYAPALYYMSGANVYYNAEMQKLVFVSTGFVSAGYGQQSVSSTQNMNSVGAVWHLAYWANENPVNIKEVEFRRATSVTATSGFNLSGIGYLTTRLTATTTVKYDRAFTNCSWGNSKDTSALVGMLSLKSAGHGSFATDGTFTATTYKEGTVNLTGFTGFSNSNYNYILYNCASVTEVITHTLSGTNMFEGCANLKKVTVPSGYTVSSVGANCFNNCPKFENLVIESTISAVTLGTNPFGGNIIIINVNTSSDKTVMLSALETAGITNVSVISATDEEEDTGNTLTVPKGIENTSASFTASTFTDIDDGEGWIQIGGPSSSATVTQVGDVVFSPSLYLISGGRAYFNEDLGKLVIVATSSSLSANYGDHTVKTQAEIDVDKANIIGLCIANHAKIYVDSPASATLSATGYTSKWMSNAQLAKYKPAYDEAIAAGKTEDEAKQAGGAAVAAEVFKWTKVKNSFDVGSVWQLAYFINANSSKITELEVRTTTNSQLHSCAYYFGVMKHVESVKISSAITKVAFSQSGVGAFNYMTSLVSLGHGIFAQDGTFTPTTYIEGRVDITALSASTADKLGNAFLSATGPTNVSVPRFDNNMFNGATNVAKIVVPAGFTISKIDTKAFNGCTSLEYIEILGTVDSALTITSDAFTGTSGVTVVVQTAAEKGYFESALTTAGISGVTVILASDYTKVPVNAVKAEGFSVRMKDYTGLRALFSFDETVAGSNKYDGFTLVSYGVVASSYARFVNDFNSDEDALFAAARAKTNSALKYIPVYNADGTGANKYVDYDTRTFCIALTNIASANALSDVYMAGYAIWKDASGNEVYTLTTYDMADGMKAVNLYEITFGLTKTGVINSQNTEDKCFWQILKNGALAVTESEIKTPSTSLELDVQYKFDATTGEFTYLDLPLRAWNFYKNASGTVVWNSYANNVEAVSSTNIVWSLLESGDEIIVVYRRDPNASASAVAKLPQLRDRSYGAHAPFSSNYFTPATDKIVTSTVVNGDSTTNGLYKYATIYSPIVSDANEAKITTLVIDYGVNSFDNAALENTTVSTLQTIVYPEGMSASKSLLHYNYYVKNIIYVSDNKASLTEATQKTGFGNIADLSGLTAMLPNFAFSYAKAIENVILPSSISSNSAEELFYNASSLKRVWTVGNTVPASGTLDLSAWTTLTTFDKNSLTNLPAKTKVILSPGFRGVAQYTYGLSEAVPCAQSLGKDADYTIVLGTNINALINPHTSNTYSGFIAFLDKLDASIVTDVADSKLTKGQSSATTADNMDKLTFVCTINGEEVSKSINDWRAYFIENGLYTPASN